jgi:hypothetical protein
MGLFIIALKLLIHDIFILGSYIFIWISFFFLFCFEQAKMEYINIKVPLVQGVLR